MTTTPYKNDIQATCYQHVIGSVTNTTDGIVIACIDSADALEVRMQVVFMGLKGKPVHLLRLPYGQLCQVPILAEPFS